MKHTLINVEEHEIRIAILEDGKLVELFNENPGSRTLVGNIYKGKITDLKPGIQAAFVDIGLPKNAFLHFDDVRIEAVDQFLSRGKKLDEPQPAAEKDRKRKARPRAPRNHAELLQPGQELMVQVIKDPISAKGCRVSANVSLPGRYLVSLPYSARANGGVSRKIEEFSERKRLKAILKEIESEGEGYIIRTSGVEQTREEILGDVEQLRKTWHAIVRKAAKVKPPALLHNDDDIILRVARDILQSDVNEIWIDSRPEFLKLSKYIKAVIPALDGRLSLYNELAGLFDRFDVERQIVQALRRKFWLKSGGTLIFDEMEAMTAIDVNTGKFTGQKNPEKTVLKTNLEAARAIAAQLRLRDIGGLVVIDFIDMESNEDRKKLVHELNACMKSDRAKHTILSVNEFGLVALTRKRVRESLKKFYHSECPHCDGSGLILTEQQIWRAIKRELQLRLESAPRPNLTLRLNPQLKAHVVANHAAEIRKWCNRYRIEIQLLAWQSFALRDFEIETRRKIRGRCQSVGETRKYIAWQQASENPYKGKALPSIGARHGDAPEIDIAPVELPSSEPPAPENPAEDVQPLMLEIQEQLAAQEATMQPAARVVPAVEAPQPPPPADAPLVKKRSRRRRRRGKQPRAAAAVVPGQSLPAITAQAPSADQGAPQPASVETPAEHPPQQERIDRPRRRRSLMSNTRKQRIAERRRLAQNPSAPHAASGIVAVGDPGAGSAAAAADDITAPQSPSVEIPPAPATESAADVRSPEIVAAPPAQPALPASDGQLGAGKDGRPSLKFSRRRPDRRGGRSVAGFKPAAAKPATAGVQRKQRGNDLLDRVYAAVKAKYETPPAPQQTAQALPAAIVNPDVTRQSAAPAAAAVAAQPAQTGSAPMVIPTDAQPAAAAKPRPVRSRGRRTHKASQPPAAAASATAPAKKKKPRKSAATPKSADSSASPAQAADKSKTARKSTRRSKPRAKPETKSR